MKPKWTEDRLVYGSALLGYVTAITAVSLYGDKYTVFVPFLANGKACAPPSFDRQTAMAHVENHPDVKRFAARL